MDIASVFEWFAQESAFAAETTNVQQQREIWLRLGEMWTSAATQCRHGENGKAADAGQQTPTMPPPPELASTSQIASNSPC